MGAFASGVVAASSGLIALGGGSPRVCEDEAKRACGSGQVELYVLVSALLGLATASYLHSAAHGVEVNAACDALGARDPRRSPVRPE